MSGRIRRRPVSPFPDDMLQRLDRLGRCKTDMMNSGIDWPEVIDNCIVPFHEQAAGDPGKFISDLMHVIDDDTDGFATYGAACLMYELAPGIVRTEAGAALVDRAIEFKRGRGLSLLSFTRYEQDRYYEKSDRRP